MEEVPQWMEEFLAKEGEMREHALIAAKDNDSRNQAIGAIAMLRRVREEVYFYSARDRELKRKIFDQVINGRPEQSGN